MGMLITLHIYRAQVPSLTPAKVAVAQVAVTKPGRARDGSGREGSGSVKRAKPDLGRALVAQVAAASPAVASPWRGGICLCGASLTEPWPACPVPGQLGSPFLVLPRSADSWPDDVEAALVALAEPYATWQGGVAVCRGCVSNARRAKLAAVRLGRSELVPAGVGLGEVELAEDEEGRPNPHLARLGRRLSKQGEARRAAAAAAWADQVRARVAEAGVAEVGVARVGVAEAKPKRVGSGSSYATMLRKAGVGGGKRR